jgi:hypothetical protein
MFAGVGRTNFQFVLPKSDEFPIRPAQIGRIENSSYAAGVMAGYYTTAKATLISRR